MNEKPIIGFDKAKEGSDTTVIFKLPEIKLSQKEKEELIAFQDSFIRLQQQLHESFLKVAREIIRKKKND